jgi:hypothetical protein
MEFHIRQLRDHRPPETILKMERGVASRGCGANRTAGGLGSLRRGLGPLRTSRWRLRSPNSRRPQHGSPAENRHGGAPREVPFATGQAAPQGSEVKLPGITAGGLAFLQPVGC